MIDTRTATTPPTIGPDAINADPGFIALSKTFHEHFQTLLSEIQKVSSRARVDDLPEIYIDLLATEYNVPGYRSDYPLDKKRWLIKNAFQLNANLGTPYGIKQLLTHAFNHSQVIEWFDDTEPDAQPYTFRILTTDRLVDPEKVQQLAIFIENSKNVRSQLRSIKRIQYAKADTYVANAQSITKRTLTTTTINN